MAHLWNCFWEACGNRVRLTPLLIERFVLAKLYFDPRGLLVAMDNDRAVGFAHAGFGPRTEEKVLDPTVGVIAAFVVPPGPIRREVMQVLLSAAEEYLRIHGASVIFFGGSSFPEPFWLGLAYGPRLPGVADNDLELREFLAEVGYQPVESRVVLERSLRQFTVTVTPELVRCHRELTVNFTGEPLLSNWWELTTLDPFELLSFELVTRIGNCRVGRMRLFIREMAANPAGCYPIALWDIDLVGTCPLSEAKWFFLQQATRELARGNAATLEIQVSWPIGQPEPTDLAHLRTLLGMTPRFQGTVFRKDLL
ncbi:MAG: hypothetical protein NZ899_08025 [Thermoguttaceae bacterium]|nr:hypothetical protein [Thermoguttaceae bacterium]MDW8078108.1 hypothetical protein [Thermoguttaceae bacterium]